MSIAGNLRTMALADLLQWLSASGKTGTLVIDGPEFTKKLYFRRGSVVAVASDNPREMLGYYLVGWDHITEDDLQYVIEMQGHFNVMLGEIVVKMGLIGRNDLNRVLLVKTQETIFDLLLWEEADFRFLDGELPERDFLELDLPLESFLVEGFRQRSERQRISAAIPGSSYVPVLKRPPETGLEPFEKAILIQIDGQRSIARIALDCRVPEFRVLEMVYRWVMAGAMEVLAPTEGEAALPGASDAPWLELLADICDRVERRRLLEALELIQELRERYGGEAEARELVVAKEIEIETCMDEDRITSGSILEPGVTLDALLKLDCTPAEGFVLSRINGTYSVEAVLRQLPGSALYNRAVLHNLVRRGLIKLREVTSVRPFRGAAALGEHLELPDTLEEPGS